jgi:hypothetical protein
MLSTTIKEIKAANITNIVVIGPAPRFEPSLPSMLLQNWSNAHWSSIPNRLKIDRRVTDSVEGEIKRISLSEGAQFFSLLDLFCNVDGCLTKTSNSRSRLLTWDYGHLTTDGAVIVAQAIRDLDKRKSASKGE